MAQALRGAIRVEAGGGCGCRGIRLQLAEIAGGGDGGLVILNGVNRILLEYLGRSSHGVLVEVSLTGMDGVLHAKISS